MEGEISHYNIGNGVRMRVSICCGVIFAGLNLKDKKPFTEAIYVALAENCNLKVKED